MYIVSNAFPDPHGGGASHRYSFLAPGLIAQAWSEAQALGAAVWLWMQSPMHRSLPLVALHALLLPPIKRRQFFIAACDEQPVFYAAWALFDLHRFIYLIAFLVLLGGCSVEKIIRETDNRYLQPGALDSPLTGLYSVYSFKLVGRYRVTYQWVGTSGCEIRARRLPQEARKGIPFIYEVPDIYEAGGKTWQGSNLGDPPMDLDPWMGSVKVISRAKEDEGRLVEVGMNLLCQEAWWNTSHYLFVRMRRATVDAVQAEISAGSTDVPARWSDRELNGRKWRVMEVPLDQLRPRRLNATGAPYQAWITALGDTGYAIAFSLGASKESMEFPKAHAAFEATFQHLLDSLKVEPL